MPSPPRHPQYQYPDDVSRLAGALMSLNERKLERERQARLDARQAEIDKLAQEETARRARMDEDKYQLELGAIQQRLAGETPTTPGGKVSIAPNKITLEEPPLPAELQPTAPPLRVGADGILTDVPPEPMELPLSEGLEAEAPSPSPREYRAKLSSGEEIPFPLRYKEEMEAEERRKMLLHPTVQAALIRAAAPSRTAERTPAVGSFEDYVTQSFGERPTAEQVAKARRDWSAMAREPKAGQTADVSGFVDDFAAGYSVLSDVPMSLRDEVKAQAKRRGIHIPTRKLTEKAIGELTDTQALLDKTRDLESLPSSYSFAVARWTPDFIRGFLAENTNSKFYKTAMQYDPVYFMYAAETLKAVQGSRPSDFDMETYLANLPKMTDPPEVKQSKVDRLFKQLAGKYNTKLKAYQMQGFNTGGFEPFEMPTEKRPANIPAPPPGFTLDK